MDSSTTTVLRLENQDSNWPNPLWYTRIVRVVVSTHASGLLGGYAKNTKIKETTLATEKAINADS